MESSLHASPKIGKKLDPLICASYHQQKRKTYRYSWTATYNQWYGQRQWITTPANPQTATIEKLPPTHDLIRRAHLIHLKHNQLRNQTFVKLH